MATLSPWDERRWDRLGGHLAAVMGPGLDPRVLGNRARCAGGVWELRSLGPALSRARRLASSLGRRSPAVLRTDVQAFYPSVRPEVLYRVLRASGATADDARLAADLLEAWGSEGYPGLPIGPRASAVLANAVLTRVDGALAGSPFLRWVDDYLVALPARDSSAAVLERIDEALDGLGLTRSASKTTIGRGSVRWLGGTFSLAGMS
jgi:hypothetical protein